MRFNASRKRSVSPFGSRFESWWAHQPSPPNRPWCVRRPGHPMSGRSTSRAMRFNASRKRAVSPFGSRFESWWAHQFAVHSQEPDASPGIARPGAWPPPGFGLGNGASRSCGPSSAEG